MAQTYTRIEVDVCCPENTTAAKMEEMLNRLAVKAVPTLDGTFKNVVILEADPTTCDNPNCGCHPRKEE